MPAKNHLTSEQEKLQKALKREENGDIRERILILLLLNDGKTQSEIAEFIRCSKNKVCYWCVQVNPDNSESLKDERMKGNHQKATEKYIEILLKILGCTCPLSIHVLIQQRYLKTERAIDTLP